MSNTHRERLPNYNRVRGGSPDTATAFLAAKAIALDIRRAAKDASPFRALLNAAYLDGMYLSYVSYGTPVQLRAQPPRGDYGVILPVDGTFRALLDRRLVHCGRDETIIASPSMAQTMELSNDCRRIGISFGRDTVVRQLSALLGEPIGSDPVFEPRIELARPPGRRLQRVLEFVLDELECVPPFDQNRLWRRELEQLAVTALLLNLRHDFSDRLQGPESRAVPADVKRAIDYLQGNLERPVTLSELTTAAGVSGSTLLRHFRRFTGKSPLAYVRAERLRRARSDLSSAENGASVTEVAARWGFEHFGRFAAEYRRCFGELPSDTRRRSS